MYQNNAYSSRNARVAQQHYRQDQILSADPLQLLIMTYDYIHRRLSRTESGKGHPGSDASWKIT